MNVDTFNLSSEVNQINSFLYNLRDHSQYDDEINNLINQILTNGGKRIRPLICLLSYEMISGRIRDDSSIAAACAVEIIHNASLVIDDIFDKDIFRRKQKSFYLKYSTFSALSVSYSMSSLALKLASDTNIIEIVEQLINAISILSSSLFLERKFRESDNLMTKEEALKLIDQKTAILFQTASEIGFILGKSTKDNREKIRDFGLYIGRAFQLRDDYLSLISKENDLGKSGVITDITNRIQTFIVIDAFEKLPKEQRIILESYYLDKETIPVETIRELLLNPKTVQSIKKKVLEYLKKAENIIGEFPQGIAKDKLLSIVSMLVI